MFFQWREHKHAYVSNVVVDDEDEKNMLRQFGIHIFFQTSGM
jgi:hypothetical protein